MGSPATVCIEYNGKTHIPDSSIFANVDAFCESLGVPRKVLEEIPYYEQPFKNSEWEFFNIGVANMSTDFNVLACQLEMKFLEEFLKTNTGERASEDRLNILRIELKNLLEKSGYVD